METVAAMARAGLVVVALAVLAPFLIVAAFVLYIFPTSERYLYTREYRRLCYRVGGKPSTRLPSPGSSGQQAVQRKTAGLEPARARALADPTGW